jgi:hypothetical protein
MSAFDPLLAISQLRDAAEQRLVDSETPMFPSSVTVGDVTVTLHADGTATGDVAAFRAALAQQIGCNTPEAYLLWTIAAQLRAPKEPRREQC